VGRTAMFSENISLDGCVYNPKGKKNPCNMRFLPSDEGWQRLT